MKESKRAYLAMTRASWNQQAGTEIGRVYKESQRRKWVSSAVWSRAEMRPTILRTRRDSTVASCALTALATFRPAACQSASGKSAWPSLEVRGTTNKSPGKVPRPMTMAGRTLVAAQVRERNGQEYDIVTGAEH